MAEGALNHPRRVVRPCVAPVLSFQQFQLLVQQILRQLVPVPFRKFHKKTTTTKKKHTLIYIHRSKSIHHLVTSMGD